MGDEGIKECCGNAMGPGETGQLALPLGTTHVCRFISCTRFLPLWSIPSAVVPGAPSCLAVLAYSHTSPSSRPLSSRVTHANTLFNPALITPALVP